MRIRMKLVLAVVTGGLSLIIPFSSCVAQRTTPGGDAGPIKSPILVTIVVRDSAGGSTGIAPNVQIYGESQDGTVFTGRAPRNRGDQWTFEVPGLGTYTVEVSAPGYKTAQKIVGITNKDENQQVDITLEPDNKPGKAKGVSVLAPKAREELDKGKHALTEKNFDEAKAHLEKALQLAPTSPEVNYFAGLLYYYTGNLGAAIDHLQKTVSMDHGNSLALLALGETYYMQKDYPHATSALEQGLTLDPNSWRGESVLGSSYYKQAEYEKCREHAQKAVTIGKEEASTTGFLLGKCLGALGKKAEAIAAFQAFLEQQQQQPPSDMTRAAQQYLKELQANP